MKFRLKFEYSFNSIDKRIYTYKLSQNKIFPTNNKTNQDIRDKAKEIIHSIFKWSIANKQEIIYHKDEEYISQTLIIYIFICMTKETHIELNKNILSINKYVTEIQTKEDYTLTVNYIKNNYKKIIMCYIENILHMHDYEKIGNFFIRESLNIEYFNNHKKDDFHFTKNKFFKDLHCNTKFYLGYSFPDVNKGTNNSIILDKIENKEKYFLIIAYVHFQGGIIFFTECESTKKNIKILSKMQNYEFYNKKYLTRIKLTMNNNKLVDYESKLMSNIYNYNSKILLRPPYFLVSKSFQVMPYMTQNIIEIFNNYNDFNYYINTNINHYLTISLNDLQLTGYEETKVDKYLNILEDEEKDFISENIYNIITSFEEGNFILTNSNYSLKLKKLFDIYNINHFFLNNSNNNIYNNQENENIIKENNINEQFINNYYEYISPIQKFYIDMIFKLELNNQVFYYNQNTNEILIYDKSHEHIYNLKLIEFYFFIKTLNTREKKKEKELKTIETDDQSKINEDNDGEKHVELPITEKFIKKLEKNLTQNKNGIFKSNNKYNDISIDNCSSDNSYYNESIIREYDEEQIKICKNFKCNYGIDKEKKSSAYSRQQRIKKVLQNANKELEDTYDHNYVKTKFNFNKTVFNPENGKEGIYKDIIQNITLQ